jgi:predicted RNase H-like nuclease (RuvC/YqgF family)
MSEQLQNLKTLIDISVQRGMFKNAESVVAAKEAYDHFAALEHDAEELSDEVYRLRKELENIREKVRNYDLRESV